MNTIITFLSIFFKLNAFFNKETEMAEHLKHLDDSNFQSSIAEGVTLVDFHADWCGPCRTIAPIIEELAGEMEGKAVIAKVDIDKAQEVASNFQVTSIPTLILFKDGKEVERVVGVKDKQSLSEMIGKVL